MSKQKMLDAIAKDIEECLVCREKKIGVAVPGEGNPLTTVNQRRFFKT